MGCHYGPEILPGDLDGNGDVESADYAILTSAWLAKPGDADGIPRVASAFLPTIASMTSISPLLPTTGW
ncbi:MAG: hypothetical protein JSU70_08630 [Phycisphaerales bacterium]|nr:MAG: hypothetical protein JSU70_08630 [Phycisphaerales bacterium]